MDTVKSSQSLSEELVKAGVAAAPQRAAAAEGLAVAGAAAVAPPRPIAIVGVHGISPIQQYAFQDQLASGLLGYLNATETVAQSGRTWRSTPYWPRVAKDAKNPVLKPSALRLYRDDEHEPEQPTSRVYDVYEGYWSPYSKGKTNIASLLGWLLRCTFLGTSSTAKVPASWQKLGWDLGYLFGALLLALVFLAIAFVAGAFAFTHFFALFKTGGSAQANGFADFGAFWSFVVNPLDALKQLPWTGWVQLALDVVMAYLIIQLYTVVKTRVQTHARTVELRRDGSKRGRFEKQTIDAEKFHLVLAVIFALLVVLLLVLDLVMLYYWHPDGMWAVMWHGAWLVVAVAFFQGARNIADFVVEDVLGDVQVYCTHDCNSSFYAVREQIIDAVTKAVLGALKAVEHTGKDGASGEPPPLYEKIHVAGHSLGTTVALDVLMRVRQFVEEESVDEAEWLRIRSFTTFGTALEKTRFLLDVRNPSISAAQQQWQNDTYGRFFTDDPGKLAEANNAHGIFWSNHWYFRDIVCNKIVSYKSDVEAGNAFGSWSAPAAKEHHICENNRIPHPRPFWAFVHSDYIGDSLFWQKAGPVFTS